MRFLRARSPETEGAAGAATIVSSDTVTQTEHAPAFADASASLRSAKTWADYADKQTATAVVEAPAVETETTPEAKPDAEQPKPDEQPAAPSVEGFTLDESGRLHRPDGTYANQSEIDAWNATAEPTPEPKEEAPNATVVAITGRSGEKVEIEVTDPAVAEALQTLERNGMRAKEFNTRLASVQEKEAEWKAFETLLKTNPESVILQQLPQAAQDRIAEYLIAERWDAIVDRIARYAEDPRERSVALAEARVRMSDQQSTYRQEVESQRYSVQLEQATRALIPDGIDEAKAERFLRDAATDLGLHIKTHGPIPVEQAKTVLADRLALYGFHEPASGTPAVVSAPARPVARPVRSAEKPTAAPAVTKADVGATVRKTVRAQAVAASVAPAGAGAAPVRQPAIPSNATIEEASRLLKQQGNSWTR